MNSRLKYVFTLFFMALLIPVTGFATETDPKNSDSKQQEPELKEDSVVIFEDETKVSDPFVLDDQLTRTQELQKYEPKVTTYSETPSGNSSSTIQEEDSNSAMSFNFIYYIIDKFKLADPLD